MAMAVRYILSLLPQDVFKIYLIAMATRVIFIPLSRQHDWVHFNNILFLGNSMYDKSPLLYKFNKCIYNLASEDSFNYGFKKFFDLFDVACTLVGLS